MIPMREYKVEFMGYEGNDMYEKRVSAADIDDALQVAIKLLDKEDDRIVSICEVM